MKKLITAITLMLGLTVTAIQAIDTIESVEEKNYSSELFLVHSVTDDGRYLNSVSLSDDTNAPNGYFLDPIYEIGDIVQVTYSHDDIQFERKVTGEELKYVEADKYEEIKAVLNDGSYGKCFTAEGTECTELSLNEE